VHGGVGSASRLIYLIMDSSLFSKLPRELRDEIWRLSLQLSEEIFIFDEDGKPAIDAGVAEQHPLALSQTCKQIRTECHLVFYTLNQFCLESTVLTQPYHFSTCKMANEPGFKTFKAWIDRLGPDSRAALKSINISLGELHHTYVAEDDVWPRSWPIEELTDFMNVEKMKDLSWSLSFIAHAWPPRAPLPVNIAFENIRLDAPFRAIERALTDRNNGYDIAMKEGKIRVEAHATYHDAVKLCGARARRFVSVVRDRHREKVKGNEMRNKLEELRCI
jgi:hypothetical protein